VSAPRSPKTEDQMIPADLIPLKKLSKLLPRHGDDKPVHTNTLFRWALQGVRGVKLRSVLVGGKRYTTQAWVDEFVAALNGTPQPAAGSCADSQN